MVKAHLYIFENFKELKKFERLKIPITDKDLGKTKPQYTVGKNVRQYIHLNNNTEVSQNRFQQYYNMVWEPYS